MAIVTRQDIEPYTIYTIKTFFSKLTINTLFTFLNTINSSIDRYFRLSVDNGDTYDTWIDLTDSNIRAISINPSVMLVVQVRYKSSEAYLLINDASDLLLINDGGDATLIS